jgi:glycerol-3-phosphate O-acyltransferase / dihydroxyacetone phosphate acyltransferase
VRINPVLRLIYLFLRLLSKAGIGLFYKKRTVLGREHLRFDGPAIVVSNHPSTLIDPLNTGVEIRQEMFFLANYSLFKHPVANWLLTRLFCIPVKRKEDVPEGAERNNDAAFEQSYQHLEHNGVLYVAAEGVSWMNRWVRPFKTGTARIALGMAARNHWNTDLKIIPIGLSYSAPHLFRSDTLVCAHAPIWLRDWQAAWETDPEKAVDDLTTQMEQAVRQSSIDTRDEAGEQWLTRLEQVLRNEAPLPQPDDFERSRQLAATQLDNPSLRAATNAYFDALEPLGLTDRGLVAAQQKNYLVASGLRLVLGWPLALIGYLGWFLPCYLPWRLNRRLNLYIGYGATVKILSGFFIFPLFIFLYHRLALLLWPDGWLAWAFVAYLAALGPFTERYLEQWQGYREQSRARRLAHHEPEVFRQLNTLRADLVKTVEPWLNS